MKLTRHIFFFDQYNTIDGKRIFDKDIKKIEDDARINMGVCRYCGAMVKRGEEEKHFKERESKNCEGCFWLMSRREGETIKNKITTFENGEEIETTTTICKYKKVCTFGERGTTKTKCTNKECRAYGVEWFTPQNTFFLKYPNGFENLPLDLLQIRGFVFDSTLLHCEYFKKLGSYTLQAILHYENGKPNGIVCYRVYNCRKDYRFRYENKELFIDKYSFGWRQVKTLEGIPENIMIAINNICNF